MTALLERLEPRVLLAADVVVGFNEIVSDLGPLVPGDRLSVRANLSNVGDEDVAPNVSLRVYASVDQTIGAEDILLGEVIEKRLSLKAGSKGSSVPVKLTVSDGIAPGDYYFLIEVDSGDTAPGDDPVNNVAELTDAQGAAALINVSRRFGNVPGRSGSTKLTQVDDDGTTTTFSLSGPGVAELVDVGNDELVVQISGADKATKLSIRTDRGGDGLVDIAGITSDGPLSINGTTSNVTGDVAIHGDAKALVLHNIGDGAFSIDGVIGSAKVSSWGAGTLEALSIGTLSSTGAFNASVVLMGDPAGKQSFKSIKAGSISGATWQVQGDGGSIKVSGSIDGWSFTLASSLKSLTAGVVSDSSVSVDGDAGSWTVQSWGGGAFAFDTAKQLIAKGEKRTGEPGDLLLDLLGRGADSGPPRDILKSVKAAGLVNGLWVLDGPVSSIVAGDSGPEWVATINGELRSLKLGSASAGVARGVITAQSLRAALLHDVAGLTVMAGAYLGNDAAVGGQSDDADSYSTGLVSKFSASGSVSLLQLFVGVDPVNGVLSDGDDTIDASGVLKSFSVRGAMDQASVIAAATLPKKVKIASALINPIEDQRFLNSAPVLFDFDPPQLNAQLAQDAGVSATDGLTNDPTVVGTITDQSDIAALLATLGDGAADIDVTSALGQNNGFTLSPSLLAQVNGGALADGPYTLKLVAIDASGNASSPFSLSFTLETVPPANAPFSLNLADRIDAANPALTAASVVSVSGQTDSGQTVSLEPLGLTTTAGPDGGFSFTGVAINEGLNGFTTVVKDDAGNKGVFSLTITRIDPAVNPVSGDSIVLTEGTNWLTEKAFLIDLGQETGSRHLSFEVEATLDVTDTSSVLGDLLEVYLVDPMNPGVTLLDRGREGEAIFSLTEDGADFLPGLVTFNGAMVSVDLTSLGSEAQGLLVFQLINGDSDETSHVTISGLTNRTDEEGMVSPPVFTTPALTNVGGAADTSAFVSVNNQVDVLIDNVRVDGESGVFLADLRLRNQGAPISRGLAVRFSDLPQGIIVANASGVDGSGRPYLNLAPAVASGGLDTGATTNPVELRISNPDLIRFTLQLDVLSTGPNQAPQFAPIAAQSVMPGDSLTVLLDASDPDGDPVNYSLVTSMVPGSLPTTKLAGNQLTFTPSPDQVGDYMVTVSAGDGRAVAKRTFNLHVVTDTASSTRLSGQIVDSNGVTPLPNVPVELNGVTTTTDADGHFVLTLPTLQGEDTLNIRADEANVPGTTYPFVAEKVKLLLAAGPFEGVNNLINRPIFLPALDVAGGTLVDPVDDVTVEQELAPGEMAAVFVEAGTLLMDDGAGGMIPFSGVLSVTEVPPDLTPASLPSNLLPDLVVTIQPAEMVFSVPARLTLPNRAGYSPGTLMDLWSINPVTGLFDKVGEGQVSADGSSVETISGGILNSSWHFFVQPPKNTNPSNPPSCQSCKAVGGLTSQVEFDAGSLREEHNLVTYQSLGSTRGITLEYDSLHADPRPIVQFDYDDVSPVEGPFRLTARLDINRDGITLQAPGASPQFGLPGGEHFWTLPSAGGDLQAAIQVDLSELPTGLYDYELENGFLRFGDTAATGSLSMTTGSFVHVNGIDSAYGAGWSVGGLQTILETSDGRVVLLDGDHMAAVYSPPLSPKARYEPVVEDFSDVRKMPDGTFSRTLKDQTIYQFDAEGRLESVTDRNSNQTRYNYDDLGRIVSLRDPVGLETVFTYANNLLSSIQDPAARVTTFNYDAAGNLIRITDPDGTSRQFEYDSKHHLIAETDQNGNREQAFYDARGRITGAVRKDGSQLLVQPNQTTNLFSEQQTTDFANAPMVLPTNLSAQAADANGNVATTQLDELGQIASRIDSQGVQASVVRNSDNLVTSSTNGRGDVTNYEYDDRGNLISVTDAIVRGDRASGSLFAGEKYAAGGQPITVATADFNDDGFLDVATANRLTNDVSVLIGNGDGTFRAQMRYAAGTSPQHVIAEDVSGDGIDDLIVTNLESNDVSVLLGNGDGTFAPQEKLDVGTGPLYMAVGDLNGDGFADLAVANDYSNDVSVLLGRGDGTWEPEQRIGTGALTQSVAIGDFNGDNINDLAVAVFDLNSIVILIGVGDGTFMSPQSFDVDAGPVSIVSTDFDGNGTDDLVVAHRNLSYLSAFAGNGDGTFGAAQVIPVGNEPFFVTVGDFNIDGVPDLAVANVASLDTSILLGKGDGSFQSEQRFLAGKFPIGVGPGDFDGDGFPDLAVANRDSNDVSILIGRGDGTLRTPARFDVGNFPRSVTTGDFDRDGLSDLITANYSDNNVSILLGEGSGTFGDPQFATVGSGPISVTSDDFNGDGFADIVAVNQDDNDISVLLGKGDGSFMPQLRFAVGTGPYSVTAGDFNGDDISDLAVTNTSDDNVSILLGHGDGTFLPHAQYASGNFPSEVRTGDFNGDSFPDLAVGNQFSADVSILLGNGDGTFQEQQRFGAAGRAYGTVVADFNDDAIADVVTANGSDNSVSVLLGNGDGTLQQQQSYATGNFAFFVSTGDFNGDGFTDLAVTNHGTEDISILSGNGDGTFQPERRFDAAAIADSLTVGDFNNDGAADLALTGGVISAVVVLLGHDTTDQGSQSLARPRTYTYDSTFNQLTSVTDELGHLTIFDVDPLTGNNLSTRRVVGHIDSLDNGEADDVVIHYSYLPNGLVDTATDAMGHVTDYDYDARGRLIAVTFAKDTPDEATQQFEYDLAGNLTATTDENGHRSQVIYDALNREAQTIEADPDGPGPLPAPVTTFIYDSRGNVIRTTDPAGAATSNVYDAMDRLITTRDNDGNETTIAYDPDGNVIARTDANGNTARYTYDARNRQTSAVDPDEGVTTFRYDGDDNLIILIDPVGNLTRFFYDARSRLTREVDPLGKDTRYTYDAVDNRISTIDRNHRITLYDYDDVDRLVKETWLATGTEGGFDNTIAYTYDKTGNLLSAIDEASTLTYTYDNRNRVATVDNTGTLIGSGLPAVVLTYSYDGVGNVVSVVESIDGEPGAATTYEHDGLNRTTRITQTGAPQSAPSSVSDKRVDFAYNATGQFTSINRFSDLAGTQLVIGTNYLYDNLNRLTSLAHSDAGGATIAFYDYEYDPASRITAITDIDGRNDYTYDDRGQLTAANRDLADPRGDEAYIYDANGNRVDSHLHGAGYVTGPGNRLLSDGTYNYSYDTEGNMIRRTEIATGSVREFEWDHRNRLTSLTDMSGEGVVTQVVTYVYDAGDRRIAKTVDINGDEAGGERAEYYVYDGENVVLEVIDADGALATEQPALVSRNLFGPGVDEILAVGIILPDGRSLESHWLLADHLGTIRDIVDGGNLQNHVRYDSFGSILYQSEPTITTRYAFTGREFESETILYYYRARYYDANIGRFVNEDPIGFEASDANIYRYVLNQPLSQRDPSGKVLQFCVLFPEACSVVALECYIQAVGGFAEGYSGAQLPPEGPFTPVGVACGYVGGKVGEYCSKIKSYKAIPYPSGSGTTIPSSSTTTLPTTTTTTDPTTTTFGASNPIRTTTRSLTP